MNPAPMNRLDLNKACVTRWKKANCLIPKPRMVTIRPSWLKVDKATTFLMSSSSLAPRLDKVIVIAPIVSRAAGILVSDREGVNRISRYTPAVTRVDECTRAETGVGAAMAAGSHAEKGICADLVRATRLTKARAVYLVCLKVKFQDPPLEARAIARRTLTSPIRLLRTVSIPAL